MKISIVIPAYNEEKCLPATLAQIAAALAKFGGDSETIVVDNESTDNTARTAKSFGAKATKYTAPAHPI